MALSVTHSAAEAAYAAFGAISAEPLPFALQECSYLFACFQGDPFGFLVNKIFPAI